MQTDSRPSAAEHSSPFAWCEHREVCLAQREGRTAQPQPQQIQRNATGTFSISPARRPSRTNTVPPWCGNQWAKRDSNPRHPACKAGALNQLSYSPRSSDTAAKFLAVLQRPCRDEQHPRLQRDADRKQHAITEDQNHRSRTGVTGSKCQIPDYQHEYGQPQDDEISWGQHEMPGRSLPRTGGRTRVRHIEDEATTVPGFGQVQTWLRLPVESPILHRARLAAADRLRDGGGAGTTGPA